MAKKNLFKKIASVAMAGALTLSMALPVGAATNDPNLVVEENTLYSTQIKAGKEVTLGLMPGNAYYQRSGFDSAADAASSLSVDSITVGSDKIDTSEITYGSMKTTDYAGNATWAGTVTVKGKDGAYGPASLHIVNENSDSDYAYIDMTVYMEAAKTQSAVDVAEVSVADVREGEDVKADKTGLNVAAAETKSANPFNGASGSAQTYPTAGDALYSAAEAAGMSFTQNDGYVQSITTSDGEKLEAYTDHEDWSYYGWNYCVIRDGEKVTDGDIVSASVLEVKADDKVYWAFGTMDQAAAYFNNL